MLEGDFSGLSQSIRDPLTGQPFPGNRIPASRISNASRSFFPYVLQANSTDGLFRAVAPVTDDTYQYTLRLDQQLTSRQRIYGRWVMNDNTNDTPGYSPDVRSANETKQHNIGVNYTNSLTSTMLLTATGGYLKSDNRFTSPVVGTTNLVEQAGIQGIGTAGREDFVGLPNVGITGYTGFNTAFGVNGRLWSDVVNAKVGLTWVRGGHSLSTGYEFNDRSVYGRHGSHSPRGSFDFNGQYTGNGFADFLLGLTSGTRRNFPLETFGLDHSAYSGAFVQDFWKVRPNLTLSLGVRYEYWHAKSLRAGNGATFDPAVGRVIAGVDDDGNVNLSQQPVSPFLAAASEGLWVAAPEVGVPAGLFDANGHISPRIGLTWRPDWVKDFVIRGGYGIYYNGFTGNRSASSIVGLPYWTWEALSFSAQTLQQWETAWPSDPQTVHPAVGGRVAGLEHRRGEDARVQCLGAEGAALQLRADRLVRGHAAAQSGLALSLQRSPARAVSEPPGGEAVSRSSASSTSSRTAGPAEYNGLQIKWERRFADGLSFTGSYSLAKDTSDSVAADEAGRLQPFVPNGYLKGRSAADRRHMLWINWVYELPFGREKRYLAESESRRRSVPRRLAGERHQQLRLGRAAQRHGAWRHARQRLGHTRQCAGRPGCLRPVT